MLCYTNRKVLKDVHLNEWYSFNYCLTNIHSFSPFSQQYSWEKGASHFFDFGFGCVTDFGQWDICRHDMRRDLEWGLAVEFDFAFSLHEKNMTWVATGLAIKDTWNRPETPLFLEPT